MTNSLEYLNLANQNPFSRDSCCLNGFQRFAYESFVQPPHKCSTQDTEKQSSRGVL